METEVLPTVAQRFHEAITYRFAGGMIAMGEPPNLRQSLGKQDRAIKPPAYKDTSELDGIALPREPGGTALSALDALAGIGSGDHPADAVPDLARLARLALWSNGVFRRVQLRGATREFRCYSCSGGLYHLELYFVCADVPGLRAGVYHYSAKDHTFRRVRDGDHRATVVAATGHEPATATAPVVVVCTSTFWRNAWRYRERSYRHAMWDAGTPSADEARATDSIFRPARPAAEPSVLRHPTATALRPVLDRPRPRHPRPADRGTRFGGVPAVHRLPRRQLGRRPPPRHLRLAPRCGGDRVDRCR